MAAVDSPSPAPAIASADVWLVFCTFPDEAVARQVATTLVEERLAACVNLKPGVTSIYRWVGKVESATEVLAILKTTAEAYARLEPRLLALHPYDIPEVLALPVTEGSDAYLQWVQDSVG